MNETLKTRLVQALKIVRRDDGGEDVSAHAFWYAPNKKKGAAAGDPVLYISRKPRGNSDKPITVIALKKALAKPINGPTKLDDPKRVACGVVTFSKSAGLEFRITGGKVKENELRKGLMRLKKSERIAQLTKFSVVKAAGVREQDGDEEIDVKAKVTRIKGATTDQSEQLVRERREAREEAERTQAQARQKRGRAAVALVEAEDALARLVDKDPKLNGLKQAEALARTQADRKTEALLDAQDVLDAKLRERAEVIGRIVGTSEPDPADLERLAALMEEVQQAQAQVATLEDEVEEAEKAVQAKSTALSQGIDEAGGAIAIAREQLAESLQALEEAESEEDEADLGLAQSKADEAEAERLARIEPILQETERRLAESSIKQTFERLKGLHYYTLDDTAREEVFNGINKDGEFALAVNAALNTVDEQYDKLSKAGATPQELADAFASVPSEWRPADLVDELKMFDRLQKLFEEEHLKELEELDEEERRRILGLSSKVGEVLETGQKGLETVNGIRDSLTSAMKSGGSLAKFVGGEKGEAFAKTVESIAKISEIVGKSVETESSLVESVKSGKESMEVEDPIQLKMKQEDLLKSLYDLHQSGMGIAALFVPGLDIAVSAMALGKAIKDAADNLSKRAGTAELLEIARQEGHGAASALVQSEVKLRWNIAQDAADAVVNALKGAGGLSPEPLSKGILKAVASGISTVSGGVQTIRELKEAQKVRELLDACLDDNEDIANSAKRELFEHSPRYAKGMLALLAIDGDKLGLGFASVNDLTEDEVAKSTFTIVRAWLLRRSRETDDIKTLGQRVQEKVSLVQSIGRSVKGLLESLQEKLRIVPTALPKLSEFLNVPFVERDTVYDGARLVIELRDQRDNASSEDARKLLETKIGEAQVALNEMRAQVGTVLNELARLRRRVDEVQTTGKPKVEPKILDDWQVFLTRSTMHHTGIVSVLMAAE